jgi:hypothetical protein
MGGNGEKRRQENRGVTFHVWIAKEKGREMKGRELNGRVSLYFVVNKSFQY